jgi:hypothetical protein
MKSKDTDIARRAVQELGGLVTTSQSARKALIHALADPSLDYYHMDVVNVFASLEGARIAEMLAGLGFAPDPDAVMVLAGLALPRTQAAADFLLEQLEKEKGSRREVAIRALLANLGHDGENIRVLRSEFAKRSDGAILAAHVVGLVGAGDWVDEEFIDGLLNWLAPEIPDADACADASLMLARVGPRAKAAVAPLKRLLSKRDEDTYLGTMRIIWGFSLARIDPTNRKQYLKRGLKGFTGNHTDWHGLADVTFNLAPDMLAAVVSLLEDEDPEVVRGAAEALYASGLRAEAAVPRLVRILEQRTDEQWEDVRKSAAWALRLVGQASCLPKMEVLLRKEEAWRVRDSLESTIKVLRFFSGLDANVPVGPTQ